MRFFYSKVSVAFVALFVFDEMDLSPLSNPACRSSLSKLLSVRMAVIETVIIDMCYVTLSVEGIRFRPQEQL